MPGSGSAKKVGPDTQVAGEYGRRAHAVVLSGADAGQTAGQLVHQARSTLRAFYLRCQDVDERSVRRRLNGPWRQRLFQPLCCACRLPCGGTRRRSGGKPEHIPGSGPFDAGCIRRRKPRRYRHTTDRPCLPSRFPWPCSRLPFGKWQRSRCQVRCTAPLLSRPAPAGRTSHSDHRLPRSRYMLRYTIRIVHVP